MSVPEISCPDCSTTMPYTAAACPNCLRRMTGAGPSLRRPSRRPAEVDYGPTPYLDCRARACAFKVTTKDLFCPSCGAEKPYLRPSGNLLQFLALGFWSLPEYVALAFLVVVIVYGVLLPGASKGLALPLALLTLWVAYKVLRRAYGEPEADQSRRSLSAGERRIRERLQEIGRREGRLLSVFARAKQSRGEDWQEVRRRLDDAVLTLRRQKARYQLKLFEIELVRWQNRLAPFLYGLEELTSPQCENRLREVEAVRKAGAELRPKLRDQTAALDASREGDDLLRKLEETLASADKIHEALLARQALLTLREVDTSAGAHEAALPEEDALRQLEVFNIQVAITDFSSSLDELEAEYARSGEGRGPAADGAAR